jgi:DNA-directed RNA polymerase subunit M/transcription elongation factor TFIIS
MKNVCPNCESDLSYRAMVDGKPARKCHSCGTIYGVKKATKKKQVRFDPDPETVKETTIDEIEFDDMEE